MVSTFFESQWAIIGLIFAFFLFFGSIILVLEVVKEKHKISRDKAYWAGRKNSKKTPTTKTERATKDLTTVSEAKFVPWALLNRSEAKVFAALDAAVAARNDGWRVMAQVSLGEFLRSPDDEAFYAINSKRVDFALMDENCCVRHAIEYQGTGHHAGTTAAARDAVKKEALRKAGIGYHEVVAGHTTPAELKLLVEKLVPMGERPRAPSLAPMAVAKKVG